MPSCGPSSAIIEPGSPGEHGDGESINCALRDEVLNGALFSTLHEAQVIVEGWRHCSNTHHPHRALGGSVARSRHGPACELIAHMGGETKTSGWSIR